MARKKDADTLADTIALELPIGDLPHSGFEASQARGRMHINAYLRSQAATGILRLRNGLRNRNAKFADGRPVFSTADALRWLLEAIAAEAE